MSVFTFIAQEIVDQVNAYQQNGRQCEQVVGNVRQGMSPIQAGAWIGMGAQAFIQEVITRLIPHILELIAAIAGFGGNMGKALNIMQNADKMVSGIVGQLGDVFDRI